MAYKETNPLVRLAIVALVAWGAWKYGLPWLKEQGGTRRSSNAVGGGPSADCVTAVDEALAVWSNGIVRFMNPPIDASAWSDFRSAVEARIDASRSSCNCSTEACAAAREVADDLRRMVSDMDTAARGGGPPPFDLVRAQEQIDLKIEEAWKLADAGR